MNNRHPLTTLAVALAIAVTTSLGGCGGGDDSPPDDQTPPQGESAVTPWIAAGHYLDWRCEPTSHPARAPSPHGVNRICNNDVLAQAGATGPFPIGAASVKEIYNDSQALIGYAVYRKLADGADGANWYWYETIGGVVVADGTGGSGAPHDVCVDCHSHAEHDFVFTEVP